MARFTLYKMQCRCTILFAIFFFFCVSTAQKKDENKKNDKNNADGKIVGGRDTNIAAVPYQASVGYAQGSRHFCGGSIIHPQYVLTAAHCIRGTKSNLIVRVGSSTVNQGGYVYPVVQNFIHPRYNSRTQENDIGLLKLGTPITFRSNVNDQRKRKARKTLFDYDVALLKLICPVIFGDTVKMIRIARAEPVIGGMGTVSGWGVNHESKKTPMRNLQIANIPFISTDECATRYRLINRVNNRMICAGYRTGGIDACQGDSGGPMVFNGEQVGVVSWGTGCGNARFPGVYASLAHPDIYGWIASHVPLSPPRATSTVVASPMPYRTSPPIIMTRNQNE